MKKEIKIKKITINELADIVAGGFKSTKSDIKSIQSDIEKLAISTANHFERLETKMATKDVLGTDIWRFN